jgi:hypothetical protein
MTDNIKLTDHDGNVVTIASTLPEEIINNPIQAIPKPKTIATEGEGITTKLINLMRIKRTFTMDGFLVSGGDNVGLDGTDTAKQQRTKFRSMCMTVRTLSFEYDELSGDDALSVGVMKASIKQVPEDQATPTKFSVKVTFISGTSVLG